MSMTSRTDNYVPPARILPLMNDLEEAFREHCNESKEISQEEFIQLWVQCVEENQGEVSDDDRHLIAQSVGHFCETVDVDQNGMISYAEFMTFLLGGLHTRGFFGNLSGKLKCALEKDPQILHRIFDKFKEADLDGNGVIEKHEIVNAFSSMAASFGQHAPNAEQFAMEYMHEMDLNDDGKVDFYEFLSYQLGRRKRPVELLLYDISNGFSKNLSWLFMGKRFEAIYHTGVVCFGTEYWYGGSLFQNEPPMIKYFGEPLSESVMKLEDSEYKVLKGKGYKVVRLGYTLYTKNEALHHLNKVLAKQYKQTNYDVLSNNCNNFSDDLVYFLTGNHIPQDIKNLPQMAMQTVTARIFRPVLNAYLGGFGGGEVGTVQAGSEAKEPRLEDLPMKDNFEEEFDQLEVNPKKLDPDYPHEDTVLAKVIKLYPSLENNLIVGYVDVKFYDTRSGNMVTLSKVPKQRLEEGLLYFANLSENDARTVAIADVRRSRVDSEGRPSSPRNYKKH